MINDFHRDSTRLGLVERARDVAMERGPGFFVDLGLQRCLERLVGIIRAEEIRVADEEAFFVVVRVDEPARDPIGAVATNFAGIRMEYVHAVDFDLNLAVLRFNDVDVRLSEDHEEIALAGILQVVRHVQVGIHARLQHWNPAKLVELRGVRVVVEGARDQHVKSRRRPLRGPQRPGRVGKPFQTQDQ